MRAVASEPVEGLWPLPDGWRWERLTEMMTNLVAGRRPKGGISGITEGYSSIGGEHLRWNGSVSLENTRYIPKDFAKTLEGARVRSGDILVVKDGATTGKTAFYPVDLEPAFVNEHVFIVRIDDEIAISKFVFYWMWSRFGFEQIMLDFRGAAQGGIGRTMPDVVSVPLPPLEAQRQIVARIDALLTEVEDGEAALRLARADLGVWRKALLKAAVTGELTASWRAERLQQEGPTPETGTALLARILTDRRTRWLADPRTKGKRYVEPAGPDVDGLPELPEGWVWTDLGALLQTGIQNGIYLPQSAYGSGEPIMRIDDFQAATARNSTALRRVTASSQVCAIYGLEEGDLVINRVNSPSHLGKSFLVRRQHTPAFFESNMMRMTPSQLLNLDYLELYASSEIGRTRMCRNAKSAVNQASINQTDVSSLPVPLPPRAEQDRIVQEVLLAGEAMSSGQVTDVLDGAATLRQSILAAAFRGTLTA